MNPIVRLEKASVNLGGSPIVRDLDLVLEPGKRFGVAGPNGSGKTTLLRAMATLLRLSSGHGTVLGADVGSEDIYGVRSKIGLIGHQPVLIPELSLKENLVHVARLSGTDQSRIPDVLAVVGLSAAAARLANASSFGMKRRIEVAQLLLRDPSLVLFDEALSGLDSEASKLIDALAGRVVSNGGAVVMVSHDADTLSSMCDEIRLLDKGKLGTR